jgi:hypothetical protein
VGAGRHQPVVPQWLPPPQAVNPSGVAQSPICPLPVGRKPPPAQVSGAMLFAAAEVPQQPSTRKQARLFCPFAHTYRPALPGAGKVSVGIQHHLIVDCSSTCPCCWDCATCLGAVNFPRRLPTTCPARAHGPSSARRPSQAHPVRRFSHPTASRLSLVGTTCLGARLSHWALRSVSWPHRLHTPAGARLRRRVVSPCLVILRWDEPLASLWTRRWSLTQVERAWRPSS